MATKPEVLIFASRDDAHSGWARVKVLEGALRAQGVSVSLINRMSSKLEDLALVAKHGVVSTPLVVVLCGRKTVARLREVPTVRAVLAAL